ncbi:hypothetical protein ACFE04_016370 [Oxalis oulophora]
MQSNLAILAARKSNWLLLYAANNINQGLIRRGLASGPGASRRTADPESYSYPGEQDVEPAVPSGDPEGTSNVAEPKPAKEVKNTDFKSKRVEDETNPLKPPKTPYPSSSQRVQSSGASNPAVPNLQQKRQKSNLPPILESVSCAGLDGSPLPDDKEMEQREETEQERDNKEYFKTHKASPLSEIEFADTRKPISRATDGTAYAGSSADVIVWLPEQLDTADDTLRRAAEIFRENAARGDPTLPHSRVLRELRGEWF